MLDERVQSAVRYNLFYGDKGAGRVGIDISEKFGFDEPFTIGWARSIRKSDVLYYLSYHELSKLGDNDGCGSVYGRTLWGPWVKIYVAYFKIISVTMLHGEFLREAKLYISEYIEGE